MNKTIIITGASSGIGAASARHLAEKGAEVVLLARREDELAAHCEAINSAGGKASYAAIDLNDYDAIDAWLTTWRESGRRCDVLVNNAGRSIRRPIRKSLDRFHDFERCMRLNYFAAVRLSLGLLPEMMDKGDGHIVNVSTWGTLMPAPRFAAYASSKSALDAFSIALGSEMRHHGIAVTTVHFPIVKTEMIAPTKLYSNLPGMTPEQAALWIDKAIRKRPARITPPFATLMSLPHALMPRLAQRLVNAAGM